MNSSKPLNHLIQKTVLVLLTFLFAASCTGTNGTTPLMTAAQDGEVSELQSHIKRTNSVNETNNHGWTALMFAAKAGYQESVVLLLDAGADPNLESDRIAYNTMAPYPKTTALREAIEEKHVDIARLLLKRGANADATAFAIAGAVGDVSLLEKLMTLGADPNEQSTNLYYKTPLCAASNKGLFEAAKWLINNEADVDGPRDIVVPEQITGLVATRCYPIFGAVHHEHTNVLKLLLNQGADSNVVTAPDQRTPLLTYLLRHTQWANYDNELEVLNLLLQHNANPKIKASQAYPFNGRSALEFIRDYRDKVKANEVDATHPPPPLEKLERIVIAIEDAAELGSV